MKSNPTLQWRNLRLQSFEFENEKGEKFTLKYTAMGGRHKATLHHSNEVYTISIRYFFGPEISVKNADGQTLLELKNAARWKYHWKGIYGKHALEITRTYFPHSAIQVSIDSRPVLEYGIHHEKFRSHLEIQQFAEIPVLPEVFHAILFMLLRPTMIEMMGHSIRMRMKE